VRDSIPRVVCHATHVAVVVSVKSAAARSAPSCGARWEGGNVSAIVAFATCSKQLGIKGTWAHGRVCVRVGHMDVCVCACARTRGGTLRISISQST
jgi:hypothetical protein